MNHRWHERHRDFEFFDEVQVKLVPRYKTSELSGDEWRVGARITFLFKGAVLGTKSFSDMRTALEFLPAVQHGILDANEDGRKRLMEADRELCDQMGCREKAISVYRLKKLYSSNGSFSKDPDEGEVHFRKFCVRHLRRGDCGLEDSDENYEVESGPGPDEAKPHEGDESPSTFGGAISLS